MDKDDAPPMSSWLTGVRVGVRAPVLEDAGDVAAWCDESPLPLPEAAGEMLVREERIPWGQNPVTRLMIVDLKGRDVLGSIVVERNAHRTSRISMTIGARNADRDLVEREVLGLVVPWLLNEIGLITVKLQVPADDASLIAAAEAAGMRRAVRLREYIRRDDRREDMLIFERVNEAWGRRLEAVSHA